MDGNHMKETDADRAVKDRAYSVVAAELRSFIERVERLRFQVIDIKVLEKEVFTEIKDLGYSTSAVRTILKQRGMDSDKRAEDEAILDSYKAALGMS